MILLDSSFIIAYLNEADVNHAKALRMAKDIDDGKYGPKIITDYIFDEVITVMLYKTKKLKQVAEAGEMLLRANRLFTIDGDAFDLTWATFKEQKRTMLSFTDCASIAVCRANGISNVATFDEGFRRSEELSAIGL
jgi:predicted nucleic acid-binding protein